MTLKRYLAGGMVALAAILAITFLNTGATAQTATATPPPTKIATINIVKMFNSLDEKKAGDKDIEVMARNLENGRKAIETDIETLKKEMGAYNEGTEAYRDTQERLFKRAMDLESHMRLMEQKLLMEQRLRTMALYRKMNKAIEDYSRANGIIIVFMADEVDFSNARTPQDVIGKITLRKIVYAHDTLDITAGVVNRMNEAWKQAPAN